MFVLRRENSALSQRGFVAGVSANRADSTRASVAMWQILVARGSNWLSEVASESVEQTPPYQTLVSPPASEISFSTLKIFVAVLVCRRSTRSDGDGAPSAVRAAISSREIGGLCRELMDQQEPTLALRGLASVERHS